MIKNIINLGDAAAYCDFGSEVNQEINSNVIKYFRNLRDQNILGITNITPSYNKLIIDQYEILQKIADGFQEKVTHIKPHGALNNMACEDIELSITLAKVIQELDKDIIYLVPTGSKMEIAAKKFNMNVACEIFADRNYEEDGNLVSRKKPHALITDHEEAKKHVLNMVQNQALNCYSGKKIPCEIDSVCIHGDNISSLATARSIKENLKENGLVLKSLSSMSKFN